MYKPEHCWNHGIRTGAVCTYGMTVEQKPVKHTGLCFQNAHSLRSSVTKIQPAGSDMGLGEVCMLPEAPKVLCRKTLGSQCSFYVPCFKWCFDSSNGRVCSRKAIRQEATKRHLYAYLHVWKWKRNTCWVTNLIWLIYSEKNTHLNDSNMTTCFTMLCISVWEDWTPMDVNGYVPG